MEREEPSGKVWGKVPRRVLTRETGILDAEEMVCVKVLGGRVKQGDLEWNRSSIKLKLAIQEMSITRNVISPQCCAFP